MAPASVSAGSITVPVDPICGSSHEPAEPLEEAFSRFAAAGDRLGQVRTAARLLEREYSGRGSMAVVEQWLERLGCALGEDAAAASQEIDCEVHAPYLIALTLRNPGSSRLTRELERLPALLRAPIALEPRLKLARALLFALGVRLELDDVRSLIDWLDAAVQEYAGSSRVRLPALVALAHGLCLEGDYSRAALLLREAEALARRAHLELCDLLYLAVKLRLAQVQHDAGELQDCIHSLRMRLRGRPLYALRLVHLQACHAGLRQDAAAASLHWEAVRAGADADRLPELQWQARLALASYRVRAGDAASSDALLKELFEQISDPVPPRWMIDHAFVRAYVALGRSDPHACRCALEAGFAPKHGERVACALGGVLPHALAEVCLHAAREGIATEQVRELIERYRLPPPADADERWPWAIRVQVLGAFRVQRDGAPLRVAGRAQKRTFELLQALIAFGGEDVSAGQLVDALWPDSEGDVGYHALESALYRLRRLLNLPGAVSMAGGKLRLDRNLVWVDLWALERELQEARGATQAPRSIARLRALYPGHFLAQESDRTWALEKREAVRERLLRAVRDAAQLHEMRHRWQDALGVYEAGLEIDHLAEDLYRGMMVCHRELGEHTEVLRVYRRCRELFERVLGIPPTAKTQAIYRSVHQALATQGA